MRKLQEHKRHYKSGKTTTINKGVHYQKRYAKPVNNNKPAFGALDIDWGDLGMHTKGPEKVGELEIYEVPEQKVKIIESKPEPKIEPKKEVVVEKKVEQPKIPFGQQVQDAVKKMEEQEKEKQLKREEEKKTQVPVTKKISGWFGKFTGISDLEKERLSDEKVRKERTENLKNLRDNYSFKKYRKEFNDLTTVQQEDIKKLIKDEVKE